MEHVERAMNYRTEMEKRGLTIGGWARRLDLSGIHLGKIWTYPGGSDQPMVTFGPNGAAQFSGRTTTVSILELEAWVGPPPDVEGLEDWLES